MIGFSGLSHLGIISSIALASKGHDTVIAFSPDDALCRDLSHGRFPIYEKGLAELFRDHVGKIQFTSDPAALKSCAVVHLSLDIATDDQNRGNLDRFQSLFESTVDSLTADTALVVMSQLQPGTMRRLARRIQKMRAERNINLYYQVETLIFGNAVERALNPERFIVGCENPADDLPAPYKAILAVFGCPVFRMHYESAELAKISINICLAASLSVANTMAELCESVDADWAEIIPALKTDRRIGPYSYLVPGLGIGGGNIERDLAAVSDMAQSYGTDGGTVDAFLSNSRHRKSWPIEILEKYLPPKTDNPKVGIWGIAYKADTASTKNSPAIELIRALAPRQIKAYDPQAKLDPATAPTCVQVSSARQAVEGVDALAIMTPWKEFSTVDPAEIKAAMSGRIVVDPFGVLDRPKCRAADLRQFVLGAPMETT